MRRDNLLPFGRRDDDVTRLLREEYRAPTEGAYWDALEARVLARTIGGEAGAAAAEGRSAPPSGCGDWWDAFGGWTRAGLLAACAAVLTVAATLAYTRSAEARLAYESVLEVPLPLPSQVAATSPGISAREATLRYVIGP